MLRKGVYAHGEGGLQELYPSTTLSWTAPMETMGPASVRKPQLEGGRSRVRDKTGGVAPTDYNNQQDLKAA